MNEAAVLAFHLGLHLAQYDRIYLRSETHLNEVIDWWIVAHEMKATPDVIALVKKIATDHYRK